MTTKDPKTLAIDEAKAEAKRFLAKVKAWRAVQREAAERHLAEREAEMKRRERDALIEKAALAILQGAWACPGDSVPDPRYLWLMAQQFVDAREADLAQFKDSLKKQAASKAEGVGQ